MMYDLFLKVIELVDKIGYLGIFILTFIESTFVPIPSEVTLIPAGYLVAQGKLDFILLVICSVAGTIGGSLFNYFIARKFGRALLLKYSKYLCMNKNKLQTIEYFFERYGAISTFSGRLLPGIKHFISFPAGLVRMDLRVFIFYTGLGGALFNTTLIILGYFIGENEHLVKRYLHIINAVIIIACIVIAAFYIRKHYRNKQG